MSNLNTEATLARIKILEMIHNAGTSHIASNFSVVDIATGLYAIKKENDSVVWSKGWAAATIYYFLAQEGKIPEEDLEKFAKEENGEIKYLGLAETNVNGVLCNGGSVGHGLPIAVGIAYTKKLLGDTSRVFCICSDGEMNEGAVWEAAMFAAHHKLDNLVVIVDWNHWQAMGKTQDVVDVDIGDAFFGFRWAVREINGHNFNQIEKSLQEVVVDRPLVIVATTIKGCGVSFFEDKLLYHYKNIDDETFGKALKELQNKLEKNA